MLDTESHCLGLLDLHEVEPVVEIADGTRKCSKPAPRRNFRLPSVAFWWCSIARGSFG